MQNFFSWGLYVGQVAGIRIRIHGLLLIWWAVEFNNTVLAGPVEQRKVRSAIWALGALLVFLSILLHELGHCFAARRVGGDAHEILLWPLGGLAFCALAWGYFSRRGGQALNGYGRASRVTLWVSRATVVAGVICGLYLRNIMLVVIFVWAWSGAESLKGRRY